MKNGSGVPQGTVSWQRLGIGAGGFVTGGDVADDGTLVCRTDTYGGYVRGPSATSWTPLIRIGYNGVAITDITYGYPYVHGAYDVCIHPTNSQHIAWVQDGYLWKTTNGGTTVSKTALAYNANYQPNNPNRASCRHMAYDPASTSVIVFGDPTAGARYTTDGGTTWTLISTAQIPAPTGTAPVMAVAFDRNSSVVGSRTQIVYIFSSGNGIYRSTTGIAGTFSLIASSPTVCASMVVSRAGLLMTAGTHVSSTDAQFRTWTSGGGWVAPAGITGKSIASNTTTPTTIYLFNGGGGRRVSTNSGVAWTTEAGTVTRTASDYPWLATTNETYMTNGDTCWDPNSGRIVYFIGIGVFEYVSPSSTQGAALTWNSISKGIEGMVTMDLQVLPSAKVGVAIQDRGFMIFSQANPQLSPKSHGPNMSVAINHGTSWDYCIDYPTRLVLVHNATGYGSYSLDEGKTWTAFSTVPSNVDVNASMGNIAASNYGNYVWLPTGDKRPSYTIDNGASWTLCDFGSTANTAMATSTGLHHAYTYQRRSVIADKFNPDTFYLYIPGSSGNTGPNQAAIAGLWKNTAKGVGTWTRVLTGNIGPTSDVDFYNGKLKQVPVSTYAAHLFWCCGDIGNYDSNISTGTFLSSNDGGVSWGSVALDEVIDYAFGATVSGSGFPTIYAFGYLSGVRGLYACYNFNPMTRAGTWTKVGDYPLGHYDSGNLVAADMTLFGRVYMSFGGSGGFVGNLTDTAQGT